MAFDVNNNIAHINGNTGPYDNKVNDSNVRYGRNAIANYKKYNTQIKPPLQQDLLDLKSGTPSLKKLQDIANKQLEQANSMPPLSFKLKYLPENNVMAQNLNKLALLGAAFEDLGKNSVSVKDLNKNIQNIFGQKVTAEAFDINNDGNIDVAENATAMLIKDMSDKHSTEEVLKTGQINLQASDIDGTYTQTGETNFMAFLDAKKVDESKNLISQINKAFRLDEALGKFNNNSNNLAQ